MPVSVPNAGVEEWIAHNDNLTRDLLACQRFDAPQRDKGARHSQSGEAISILV